MNKTEIRKLIKGDAIRMQDVAMHFGRTEVGVQWASNSKWATRNPDILAALKGLYPEVDDEYEGDAVVRFEKGNSYTVHRGQYNLSSILPAVDADEVPLVPLLTGIYPTSITVAGKLLDVYEAPHLDVKWAMSASFQPLLASGVTFTVANDSKSAHVKPGVLRDFDGRCIGLIMPVRVEGL